MRRDSGVPRDPPHPPPLNTVIRVGLAAICVPKVPELLRKVDVTESEYIASIMALNGYTTEFQPEMEAKLKQFQVFHQDRMHRKISDSLCVKSACTGVVVIDVAFCSDLHVTV